MEATEIHAELQQKLTNYTPSSATIALVQGTPKLFLVGIAGAGKDSIIRELMKTGNYHVIVSHTTRQPRANSGVMERDGAEYHFIDLAEAEAMIDAGRYVEAKQYGSNIYGTSAAELQLAHDNGKIALTDIEVQGVAVYMAIDPNTHAVFVLPPSYEIWQKRLLNRYGGTVDQADYTKRMATALQELEHTLHAPYFLFVVNDSLETAVGEVDQIVHGVALPERQAAARQIALDLSRDLKAALA